MSVLSPTVALMPQRRSASNPLFAGRDEDVLELDAEWALVYQQPYPDSDHEDCYLVQLNKWLPGGTGRVHLGRFPLHDTGSAVLALRGLIDRIEHAAAEPPDGLR